MTEFGDPKLPQRFWSKVSVSETGCWLWTGFRNKDGYGRFAIGGGKSVFAHRFAYEKLIGPIPKGLESDHTCRNPACVNPEHLDLVTHHENCLRGDAGKAQRTQTQCAKGHPFDLQNTGYHGANRYCKTCVMLKAREYRKAKRAMQ